MAPLPTILIAGVVAGAIASAAMHLFQNVSAPVFGTDDSDDDPATVKAADDVDRTLTGHRVPDPRRRAAGNVVHYATGIALGTIYVAVAAHWLPVTLGFGIVFGIGTAILLDDLIVPAFGWGSWPWQAGAGALLYSLSAHAVFGAVLEGARRGMLALIG